MNDRTFLSVFTPSRTPPEDLEAILVQRHGMLDDAVERIHESATTGNKHHLLFVGPRGTGKTHLVTLLVHRLGRDGELADRLRIAWLNEDETSTTLLELLRRIYTALVKRHPNEYRAGSLEPMFDLDPDEAERWLARLLLERLQGRTLLVVVENLDALFEGLGKTGQQKLRAFIQENPVLALVATAQRLVADIANRKSAFFGFFQTEHLKPLSVEQAVELLRKIAVLDGQPEVAAFLRGATGRSRIRALHHLSAGNHRIYLVLSQFITRDSIDALVGPFSKMVDEMTPYYQERIHWLPTQQRKIVEYLCTCVRPTPVKQLARRLFATQQTVSSQLKDLREKGYVQAAQRGRESLYEIAEPLMRICVEVKENQTHEPLRLLVDFLRVWYDARELAARAERSEQDLDAVLRLEGAPLSTRVDARLALAGIRTSDGRWGSALTALADGLREGNSGDHPSSGNSRWVIRAFFDSSPAPGIQRERTRALVRVYRDNDAIPQLGEALTGHLGSLCALAADPPSSDALERWASVWEDAGEDIDALRLPLRILRTGIDFLKSGGRNRGILLDLNQEERRILEQALNLDPKP